MTPEPAIRPERGEHGSSVREAATFIRGERRPDADGRCGTGRHHQD